MSFRKVVAVTLYVRQQKRHRCKEHLVKFENRTNVCSCDSSLTFFWRCQFTQSDKRKKKLERRWRVCC